MNKKAVETIPWGVIFGLIIGIIFVLILINLIPKLLSFEGQREEETSYFYFTKLAEDITKMSIGDVKNLTFLTNKELTLITFNKNQDIIKKIDLGESCIYYDLEDIPKPIKCRDKNCICLCKSDLYADFGVFLTVDCESEESRCVELPSMVNSPNVCKSFFLYDEEEKLYDLNIKKESDSFTVETLSKTL